MGITIPKEIKREVAQIIEQALAKHEQFGTLDVTRISLDGTSVYMTLKNKAQLGTFMLNITVREVM